MIFSKIIKWIRKRLKTHSKSEWVTQRFREIELHKENNDILPFKIEELKDRGFLVRVNHIYAYISYFHMPWSYNDSSEWKAAAPHLKGKVFFCKIHECDKGNFFIRLDGAVPQFRQANLVEGYRYHGVIIRIMPYGILFDIGFHFNWKCGPLIGLLHQFQLSPDVKISNFNTGEVISVFYQGVNNKGKFSFCHEQTGTREGIEKSKELIGTITWAKVVRQDGKQAIRLWIVGKYPTMLIINKYVYSSNLNDLELKKKDLKDGDIICCKVVRYDEKRNLPIVKWLPDPDSDSMPDHKLQNNLSEETVDKLQTLKSEMEKGNIFFF
ncbi:MAG: hypothetical protein LBV32_01595 [Tannerellaceae bacterium]|jgi:hypothetical protein|nr:hypothetical protein [Tannerellaceae bacterium]